MLAAFRRRFRMGLQRTVLLTLLLVVGVFSYAFLNLEFCYKVMSHNSLTHMCRKFGNQEYSGSLCEELCGDRDTFHDFKCPVNDMKTILFTAQKNGDVYAVKLAKNNDDNLSWMNSKGVAIYPKMEEFHSIVKMHIILSYNVTLDDNMIRALVNQEIDNNNAEQMLSFWRLFRDNNYMMGKLFDEESVFPAVLGSCGPYYATESLQLVQSSPSIMQYLAPNRQQRLKHILNIMEYIFHLDEMKPEPLRMCRMQVKFFGLTADHRLKYQNAEYVQVESQLDKRLSNGMRCQTDADCQWQACMGKCDAIKLRCLHRQQNNNFQIFCTQLLEGSALSPGLLSGLRLPKSLLKVFRTCVDPSGAPDQQVPGRAHAPNIQLALRLYNEFKQLYQETVAAGAIANKDGG